MVKVVDSMMKEDGEDLSQSETFGDLHFTTK